jgi:taurine dioxygenase
MSPTATLTAPLRRTAIEIRPFDAPLGAEVLGLDLSQPLAESEFARLHRAHLEHQLLVFRDQRITPAQQVAFSARWGRVQRHVMHPFGLPGHPELLIVSNIVERGQPIGLGDAGVCWQSDLSYKRRPSLGVLLHARELPAEGGDMLFANQALAWETLPAALRQVVRGRRAEHAYFKHPAELLRRGRWWPDLTHEQLAELPPVVHPAVRTHPESGRMALFVNEQFTTRLFGLPREEGDAVLAELYAHGTQPGRVYRHRWQPHDLLFWDNRSLQHLAAGCPPHQRRRLHRTTIEGEVPA